MKATMRLVWALGVIAACDAGEGQPTTVGSDVQEDIDGSTTDAGERDATAESPAEIAALTPAERDMLAFVREEEKLARDVYDALDDYGNPFVNIQSSEQSHMDAMLVLLDRYGVEDPVGSNGPGTFVNSELQALYTSLVAQGGASLVAALQVGCAIEELDIRDIEAAKLETAREDIAATFDTLLLGSRNHLRAFHRKLISAGGAYTPQHIDQAAYDAIVSSPRERP